MPFGLRKRLRASRALNELLNTASWDEALAVLLRYPELLADEAKALLAGTLREWEDKGRGPLAGSLALREVLLETCRRHGVVRAVALHRQLDEFVMLPTWDGARAAVERQPDLLASEMADLIERMTVCVRRFPDEGVLAELEKHGRILERCRRLGVAAAFATLDGEPRTVQVTLPVPAALESVVAALDATSEPADRAELLRGAAQELPDEPLLRAAFLTELGDALLADGGDGGDTVAAIAAYLAAVDALPRELAPSLWALAQEKLGLAHLRRQDGDPPADGVTAAGHFEAYLEVFTARSWPRLCAAGRLNLAASWLRASEHDDMRVAAAEDGVDPVTRAVASCRAALELLDPDRDPELWVGAQQLLVRALTRRMALVGVARAYDALMRHAEGPFTDQDLFELQEQLGLPASSPFNADAADPEKDDADGPQGFPTHPDVRLDDDEAATIAALRDVLRAVVFEEQPELWAWAQMELGKVYARKTDGRGPARDGQAATASFEAALRVLTIDAHPDENAEIRRAVVDLQRPDRGDVASGELLCELGEELLARGRPDMAGPAFSDAVSAAFSARVYQAREDRSVHALHARAYAGRALAYEQSGERADAKESAEDALRSWRMVVVESPATAHLLLQIGSLEHTLGNPVAAERRLVEAREQGERLGLADVVARAGTALDAVRTAIGDPLVRVQGTERAPVLGEENRYLDIDQAKAVTAIIFSARDAPTPEERRAALAQGLWRFGTDFLQALRRIAVETGGWSADLAEEALDLGLQWINGTPLTERLDESARRVRFMRMVVAWLGVDNVPAGVLRAVPQAIFNLPPGHPERDVGAAYEAMLGVIERSRASGDLGTQLHATYVLMTQWFELPADIEPLVAEALDRLDSYRYEDGEHIDDGYGTALRLAVLESALTYRSGRLVRARENGVDTAASEAAVLSMLERVRRERAALAADGSVSNLDVAEAFADETLLRWDDAAAGPPDVALSRRGRRRAGWCAAANCTPAPGITAPYGSGSSLCSRSCRSATSPRWPTTT